jgi:hypothetical protein
VNTARAVGAFAGLVGVGVVTRLLVDELASWGPRWAENGVNSAAAALPGELPARYREEWLGDLADIPGTWSRLVYVCWLRLWAVRRLRAIHGCPKQRVFLRRGAVAITNSIGTGTRRVFTFLVMSTVVVGGYAWIALDKTVVVSIDGEDRTVRTFANSVTAVLDQVDVGPAYEIVTPPVDEPLRDGDRVVIRSLGQPPSQKAVGTVPLFVVLSLVGVSVVGYQVTRRRRNLV